MRLNAVAVAGNAPQVVAERGVEVPSAHTRGRRGQLIHRRLKPPIEIAAKEKRKPDGKNCHARDPQKQRRRTTIEPRAPEHHTLPDVF